MSIRAILSNSVQRTRSSYWFLPTVLALCAVATSQVSIYLDHNTDSVFYVWPSGWEATQVDGARATLSVIAQSVLGVVGVMFSVTIVAVSFASGNFGPRLIGNFMRDRGTQWSLGILISTFVFALLVLRSIQSADPDEGASLVAFVPHMSLGIAIFLMGVSIMTVIYYVHHIPETINVSNISAGLGKRLRTGLEALIDAQEDGSNESFSPPDRTGDWHVALGKNGYVQTYDQARLTELAESHDLYIEVSVGVGSFVTVYTPVFVVWGPRDEATEEELRGCFVVGLTPNEDQNLLFLIQQLVEMIARALSPGMNDPYTAINCLNWLSAALATGANYAGGLKGKSAARVRLPTLTFDAMFQAGIVKSHTYIKTDTLVSDHLVKVLEQLLAEIDDDNHVQAIQDFLDQIQHANASPVPSDN